MCGLGYTYQNPLVIIGSKSGTTRTSTALTAAYTGNTKTFETGEMSKINFNILYTTGSGETNNTCEIKIETSPDGTNFYQIPNESVSGATSTLTQRVFSFTGASAATAYSFSLPLDVQDLYMKFSVQEGGVVTNYGTVYVEATINGAN